MEYRPGNFALGEVESKMSSPSAWPRTPKIGPYYVEFASSDYCLAIKKLFQPTWRKFRGAPHYIGCKEKHEDQTMDVMGALKHRRYALGPQAAPWLKLGINAICEACEKPNPQEAFFRIHCNA